MSTRKGKKGDSSFPSGNEAETDSETATSSQIRELGNGMLALQDQLSSLPQGVIRELLKCLLQHVDNGKDEVLPASGDVSIRLFVPNMH